VRGGSKITDASVKETEGIARELALKEIPERKKGMEENKKTRASGNSQYEGRQSDRISGRAVVFWPNRNVIPTGAGEKHVRRYQGEQQTILVRVGDKKSP